MFGSCLCLCVSECPFLPVAVCLHSARVHACLLWPLALPLLQSKEFHGKTEGKSSARNLLASQNIMQAMVSRMDDSNACYQGPQAQRRFTLGSQKMRESIAAGTQAAPRFFCDFCVLCLGQTLARAMRRSPGRMPSVWHYIWGPNVAHCLTVVAVRVRGCGETF